MDSTVCGSLSDSEGGGGGGDVDGVCWKMASTCGNVPEGSEVVVEGSEALWGRFVRRGLGKVLARARRLPLFEDGAAGTERDIHTN